MRRRLKLMLLSALQEFANPRNVLNFLKAMNYSSRILDVGCGNRSPERVKFRRPDCYYVGVDVGNHNQSEEAIEIADEYILCDPSEFTKTISSFSDQFEAVISAHNLEHCDDPDGVLNGMANALRKGGMLYLSFPCEESINFPSRKGTLNFFDDKTHKSPPVYLHVLEVLNEAGCEIIYSSKNHRPFPLFVLGLVLEPVSIFFNKNMPLASTWAFWGFESVIWARKR